MSAILNARTLKKERTRQRILDAAIRVFAELGFDAASMALIAKQAGLKKALVQYHFETKLNLWQEAVDHIWQQLRTLEAQMPRLHDGIPADRELVFIRECFRLIIRFAKAHPYWLAIMFREASTPGPRLDWLIERHLRHDIEDSVEFVETAQRHRLLPEGSPLHLIHIISGALTYVLLVAPMTQQVTGVDLTSEQSLDTTVDLLMKMLKP